MQLRVLKAVYGLVVAAKKLRTSSPPRACLWRTADQSLRKSTASGGNGIQQCQSWLHHEGGEASFSASNGEKDSCCAERGTENLALGVSAADFSMPCGTVGLTENAANLSNGNYRRWQISLRGAFSVCSGLSLSTFYHRSRPSSQQVCLDKETESFQSGSTCRRAWAVYQSSLHGDQSINRAEESRRSETRRFLSEGGAISCLTWLGARHWCDCPYDASLGHIEEVKSVFSSQSFRSSVATH